MKIKLRYIQKLLRRRNEFAYRVVQAFRILIKVEDDFRGKVVKEKNMNRRQAISEI